MIKIGLTGGIASGKTSIAKWFENKGIPVFDADAAVHRMMDESAMISAIGNEFGQAYIQQGRINRTLLGSKVFQDQDVRIRLENLLHPLVLQEMEKQRDVAKSNKHKLMLLDIPLLFEVGWDKLMDQVWVVYVPYSVQIERLIRRNGWTQEEAELRIASQMPLDKKAKKADRVIDNGGTWYETEKQLARIWKEVCAY